MTTKVKALQNFDGFVMGDEIDLPPEYAKGVIDLGLASEVKQKSAPVPENKMSAEPENKTRRSRAS